MPVGVVQRPRDVDRDAEAVFPIEHPGDADTLDHLGQALAFDVIHRHPAESARLAGFLQRYQVWVAERQHGPHRSDEALHVLLVLGEFRLQHLQRDGLVVFRVLGLENDAGRALGDDIFEDVA